jgi:riboflavin kinase/FMN adenylyltransferase
VIEGAKLGRKLGFPTANMKYPEEIVKIPYGVYKIKVFDKLAIMNWGIKPTIGAEEAIEIHIPNFEEDLYGKAITFEIISKIRDEKKFNNLEDLKEQIKKDIELCLK